MIKHFFFLVFALFTINSVANAQNVSEALVVSPCGTPGRTFTAGQVGATTVDTSGNTCVNTSGGGSAGTPSTQVTSVQGVAGGTTVPVTNSTLFPVGATPITASATGTTAATTATLAGTTGKTTYICGFAIRANATAAATGNATVTGTITGTLNFTQWTAPLASGIGLVEERFSPCVPASGTNAGIAVVSAAPGSGGVVSSTAWGYQQ